MGFRAVRIGATVGSLLLGFLLSRAAPAVAQAAEHAVDSSDAAERLVGRPVLEAQAVLFAPLGNVCTRSGDVVDCSPDLFLGGHLGGFYTAARWVSVGGVGAVLLRPGVTGTSGSDGSSTEVSRQLWHFGGQGRFHPLASELLVPWAGLEIGFTSIRTTIDRTGFANGENGSSTRSRGAATFAGGLGLDAWVDERVAITGQVWLAHIDLDGNEARLPPEGEQPSYTSPWWYTLGIGARVRL